MKFLLSFILFALLSTSAIQAQLPGYRGKKIVLKGNIQGLPVAGFLLANEKFYDCNLRMIGGLDMVITKSLVIGVSIEKTNDIIYLQKYPVSPNYPGNSSWSLPLSGYETAANFEGTSYGANLKFYSYKSSGSIAPFGRYVILEYLNSKHTLTDDGRFYSSGKKDLTEIRSHTFVLGIGVQKVYFNRFTFETNVKLGLNTYGISAFKKAEEKMGYDEVTKVVTNKMLSDYLINAGFGIGILLF
jgi:hypothetical protein